VKKLILFERFSFYRVPSGLLVGPLKFSSASSRKMFFKAISRIALLTNPLLVSFSFWNLRIFTPRKTPSSLLFPKSPLPNLTKARLTARAPPLPQVNQLPRDPFPPRSFLCPEVLEHLFTQDPREGDKVVIRCPFFRPRIPPLQTLLLFPPPT